MKEFCDQACHKSDYDGPKYTHCKLPPAGWTLTLRFNKTIFNNRDGPILWRGAEGGTLLLKLHTAATAVSTSPKRKGAHASIRSRSATKTRRISSGTRRRLRG